MSGDVTVCPKHFHGWLLLPWCLEPARVNVQPTTLEYLPAISYMSFTLQSI